MRGRGWVVGARVGCRPALPRSPIFLASCPASRRATIPVAVPQCRLPARSSQQCRQSDRAVSVVQLAVSQQCRRSAWASRCAPQRLAVPAVQCRLPVRSDQQNQLPVRCGQQCRQSARGSLNGVTRRQPAVPTVRLVGQPVCATKLGGKLLQCQQCIVSALLTQAEYPLPV